MKPIDVIEAMKNNYPPNADPILCEALDLAIGALEKQIVKPPTYEFREIDRAWNQKFYYCTCGTMFFDFDHYHNNYCANCGQKLREKIK